MTLQEIKKAVRKGKEVCWKSTAYGVKYSVLHDQWMVVCNINESTVGLTTLTGGELIGSEADFFINCVGRVHVIDEESSPPKIIKSFDTIKDAENYIATLDDLDKVHRGVYGIDAPEELL